MTLSVGMPARPPHFSIVICTDGRAAALSTTLRSLQYLEGPEFEVCVVRGPTEDGIAEVLAPWAGRIKVAYNRERNLSVSRNLGIAMAAGDIIAFLDDDAIPEPEWLRDLAFAFSDPDIGAAGGIVFDYTGKGFQYRFATADRLGTIKEDWNRPAPELCFPFSRSFPHLVGTNCAFRRTALVSAGGFDEEFEYYLDETDVYCRMVDQGWAVRQLPNAFVHHKFLPSALRNEHRVVRDWYPIIKNKIYFSLVNGRRHHGMHALIEDVRAFVKKFRGDIDWAISQGYLCEADRERFAADVDKAWEEGLRSGLSGRRRIPAHLGTMRAEQRFLPFAALRPEGGSLSVCMISQEFAGGRTGGVGRYIHQLSRGLASLGHHIHVLTRGSGKDRVDFEDGVWVHRIVPRPADRPDPPPGLRVPPHIWDLSATMLAEVNEIAARTRIDCVYAPIWDCEGIATLLDASFPLVTSLHTTLASWIEHNPHLAEAPSFVQDFAEPMLALEAALLRRSQVLQANSRAIVRDLWRRYGVAPDDPRLEIVPHGMEDWAALPDIAPPVLPDGALRVLFVGRLEPRKGIDVLLETVPRLTDRYPFLHFDIVGNDGIPSPSGCSYRADFEATAPPEVLARVHFHGEVPEDRLRGFYRACDVFVAPSRFESFGLVLLEAMIYAKPVVACRAGGMMEVVAEGVTSLLAEPGDAASLERALATLIEDDALRCRMGRAGRERYEASFTTARMVERMVGLFRRSAHPIAGSKRIVPSLLAEHARA